MNTTNTKAGFSKIDVSPRLDQRDTTPILGFWWERAKRWDTIHDPLMAKAAWIESPNGAVAVVSVDMIGDAIGFGDAARQRIADELGLPAERVMVASVHAHTTPETIGLSGVEPDPAWVAELVDKIVRIVADAREQARPVTLRTAAAPIDGITCNRRLGAFKAYCERGGQLTRQEQARATDLDTECRVLWAEDSAGRVRGAVVNFACHPVTVQTRPLLSADVPGHAMGKLQAMLDGAVCLYLNGATGDINPECERSFAGGESVGERIAQAAHGLMQSPHAQVVDARQVAGRSRKLSLPRRPVDNLDELREQERRLEAERRAQGLGPALTQDDTNGAKLYRVREPIAVAAKPGQLPAEVQALAIGPLRIVGVPGELLCCLGRDIKLAAGGKPTIVASYANGYLGYICPEVAFKVGGYEVNTGRWSLLARGGGDHIRDAAVELLSELG